MSRKNLSRDILQSVNSKSGKKVSSSDIAKLAKGVTSSTTQSEAQLKQLIKQVSKVANVPVADATVREIVKAVKGSGMNTAQMEQMMKMMMGKR